MRSSFKPIILSSLLTLALIWPRMLSNTYVSINFSNFNYPNLEITNLTISKQLTILPVWNSSLEISMIKILTLVSRSCIRHSWLKWSFAVTYSQFSIRTVRPYISMSGLSFMSSISRYYSTEYLGSVVSCLTATLLWLWAWFLNSENRIELLLRLGTMNPPCLLPWREKREAWLENTKEP